MKRPRNIGAKDWRRIRREAARKVQEREGFAPGTDADRLHQAVRAVGEAMERLRVDVLPVVQLAAAAAQELGERIRDGRVAIPGFPRERALEAFVSGRIPLGVIEGAIKAQLGGAERMAELIRDAKDRVALWKSREG